MKFLDWLISMIVRLPKQPRVKPVFSSSGAFHYAMPTAEETKQPDADGEKHVRDA